MAFGLLVGVTGALASWLVLRGARQPSEAGMPTTGAGEIRAVDANILEARSHATRREARSPGGDRPPRGLAEEAARDGEGGALLVVRVTEDGVTSRAEVDVSVLKDFMDEEAFLVRVRPVRGVTDGSGRVELRVPSGIPLRVLVGRTTETVRALGSGEQHGIEILYPRRKTVHFHGRVVDLESDAPIAGASVETWVLDLAGSRSRLDAPEVLSSEDGRFELHFESEEVQEHYAIVRANGYAPGHLALGRWLQGPDRPAVVALHRSGVLRVQVLDSSEIPEPRVLVTLDPPPGFQGGFVPTGLFPGEELQAWSLWQRYTDMEGRCSFPDLPAGIELRARLRKGVRDVGLRDSVVLGPGEERDVVWQLGGRADLRGFVYDQEGNPISGLKLWLDRPRQGRARYFTSNDDVFASTLTSSRGGFFFRGIPPGRWAVGPADSKRGFVPLGQLVDIPEGVAEHSVTLRVRGGLTIRGVVLDPNDDPVKWINVDAESVDDGAMFRAHCAGDGTFTLGPLLPGTYRVRAADADPVYAEAGDEDLRLRLPANPFEDGG